MSRWSALQRGVVAGAALVVATAAEADSIQVIELKHRPASEVMPMVRPLLGPNDAVSATAYRLIVRAPPATVAEIERVVREIDIARRQLTITVRHVQSGVHEHSTHGVSGEVPIGNRGSVRLPKSMRGNDTVIIGDPNGVQYRGSERRTTGSSDQTQQLRVQDGASAYLRMGQSIPHVQRVLTLAGDRWVVSDEATLRDATTGFDVRPQLRGDNRVQIDITPRVARLSDPRRGIVDFRETATSITVKLGEWIDLGRVLDQHSEINRAILHRDAQRGDAQWQVLLKID